MKKQTPNWCFTINNPSKVIEHGGKLLCFDTDEKLVEYFKTFYEINYFVFQREKGDKEATEHIQGFVQFKNKKRGTTVAKILPSAFFHNEPAQGTVQQAIDYCKKTDTRISMPVEWGEVRIRGGGQLTNEQILQSIKDGKTDSELLSLYPQLLLQTARIDNVRQIYLGEEYKNKWRDVTVTYIYGRSGAGKTRYVMDLYGYEHVYRVTDYKHPFDDYKNQKVVIFEEFRNSLPIEQMLNYLDGYPLRLPCRYFNKIAVFNKVYIISNWSFEEQYVRQQEKFFETWNAFCRRINEIINFQSPTICILEDSSTYMLSENKKKSDVKGGD